MCDRLLKRYGWKVEPEALVLMPGVIPGFNIACPRVRGPRRRHADAAARSTRPSCACPTTWGCRGTAPTSCEGPTAATRSTSMPSSAPSRRAPACSSSATPTIRWAASSRARSCSRMAEICLRHGLVICADEIHGDLIYTGHTHVPIASLDPEIEARTITLMAPSKTFNLAGLKCSLAVIPNQALREKFMASRARHGPDAEHPGLHGHARGLPGRAALAGRAPALPREQPRLPREVRPGQFPGDRDGRARGHLSRLARLPRARASRTTTRSPSSSSRGRVAFNDGATFGPRRSKASCGSTSAARARCWCRASSGWADALAAPPAAAGPSLRGGQPDSSGGGGTLEDPRRPRRALAQASGLPGSSRSASTSSGSASAT